MLTAVDGVYKVENVTSDIAISVDGVTVKKAAYTIKKHFNDVSDL